jgi:hypothetical protein
MHRRRSLALCRVRGVRGFSLFFSFLLFFTAPRCYAAV